MGTTQSSVARTPAEEQIEQIDGGSLTLENGVYTGAQDWKKSAVRALQLARRLAPFYKGLEDYDSNWTAAQFITVLQKVLPPNAYNKALLNSPLDPEGSTMTKVTQSQYQNSSISTESPFGVLLYKNAVECPICFLFYPVNIATTRCCRQPICTECFVQIRRPNPHAPIVHADETNPAPESPETLIMEAAVCPYCNIPDFGVIYEAPDFSMPRLAFQPFPAAARDVPATDGAVVLTDMIRPDWAAKLQRAKDRAARRAANAALISAHIQRQERRAQEQRLRGVRLRRRDYEAIEEQQLAEAIRLSMLEDKPPARETGDNANMTWLRDELPTTSSIAGAENEVRIHGSVPLPDLIYAPPPDSYEAGNHGIHESASMTATTHVPVTRNSSTD